MKRTVFVLLLMMVCTASFAQSFGYHIGMGVGLDMSVRLNDKLPEHYTMAYDNAALPTVNVFTRFTFKKFHFTPDFKISYATIGRGSRTGLNADGLEVPEGNQLLLEHNGTIAETIDRATYLMDDTRITVNAMSAGMFATYTLYDANRGGVEIGIGAFYFRKQLNFKDYMGYDVYEYIGSSGDHLTQLQIDKYNYFETNRDKKPIRITRIIQHKITLPVVVQLNFHVTPSLNISPNLAVYLGTETYVNLGCSVSFGHIINKID